MREDPTEIGDWVLWCLCDRKRNKQQAQGRQHPREIERHVFPELNKHVENCRQGMRVKTCLKDGRGLPLLQITMDGAAKGGTEERQATKHSDSVKEQTGSRLCVPRPAMMAGSCQDSPRLLVCGQEATTKVWSGLEASLASSLAETRAWGTGDGKGSVVQATGAPNRQACLEMGGWPSPM